MSGEFEAIERIRALLPGPPPGQTWIGDDAAVVPGPSGDLLLAADLVVAGTHADLGLMGLDDLGWKAVAVNVSDIAAMAGRPGHLLVSVAGPPGTDLDLLYSGIATAAAEFGCPVVGGDLANAPCLVVAVAVTGNTPGRWPILRSGARPGDALFLTGPLGASAAGLALLMAGRGDEAPALAQAHRRPWARVEEGWLAGGLGASAMIDVSDGLAADLGHLADASRVGVVVEHVPVAEGAGLADALGGGEDYQLLFSVAGGVEVEERFAAAGLAPPVRIGWCTPDPAERRLGDRPLPAVGWQHDW